MQEKHSATNSSLIHRLRVWARQRLPADAATLPALLLALLSDRRVPLSARLLCVLALAYLASPVDVIPDALPVLGQLDDLVIVALLTTLALRRIPANVLSDARQAHLQTYGLQRWRWVGLFLILLCWCLLALLFILLLRALMSMFLPTTVFASSVQHV